ncbi:MAG: formylglycine-generating enzyme family protein [Planctomycetota bacterium]|jgi:formylglycine-generating enzyme required for sulfatase activity
MSGLRLSLCVAILAAHVIASAASATVTIDWVTVGDAGNACEVRSQGCFGAVPDTYRIGKYEVTNAQYAEFLNAAVDADPYGLYQAEMANHSGITRSGSSGSYSHSTVAGPEDKPVVYVDFYDKLRFTSWLNNGQGGGDTETGAYTLLGGTAWPSNGLTVTRNASTTIFWTSEDEWYKAAYYDGVSTNCDPYPFADGFSGVVCEGPAGTTTHSANCANAVNTSYATDVGAYTTSPSDYGTVDQGGNLWEWNEAIISGSLRGTRSGSADGGRGGLVSEFRLSFLPSEWFNEVGLRVASVPESFTTLLRASGLAARTVGQRRRRL